MNVRGGRTEVRGAKIGVTTGAKIGAKIVAALGRNLVSRAKFPYFTKTTL
jgi:hypothetical protein